MKREIVDFADKKRFAAQVERWFYSPKVQGKNMPASLNIIGLRFGKLVVKSEVPKAGRRNRFFLAECDCGNISEVRGSHLTYGQTTSCGCRNGRRPAPGRIKVTALPEYAIWRGMLRRCRNPNATDYADYGGRGIAVCARWTSGECGLTGFECFFSDLGPRPSPKHTLDRTANDGAYAPDNVTWKLNIDQQQNRRITRRVIIEGESISLADACRQFGVPFNHARKRIERGATTQTAFEAALKKMRS